MVVVVGSVYFVENQQRSLYLEQSGSLLKHLCDGRPERHLFDGVCGTCQVAKVEGDVGGRWIRESRHVERVERLNFETKKNEVQGARVVHEVSRNANFHVPRNFQETPSNPWTPWTP